MIQGCPYFEDRDTVVQTRTTVSRFETEAIQRIVSHPTMTGGQQHMPPTTTTTITVTYCHLCGLNQPPPGHCPTHHPTPHTHQRHTGRGAPPQRKQQPSPL